MSDDTTAVADQEDALLLEAAETETNFPDDAEADLAEDPTYVAITDIDEGPEVAS